MNKIIDFHTHCFADALAGRAMAALSAETNEVTPCLDGRVSSLIESMDKNGIEKSVVCPIATKPKQYQGIFQWCKEITSDRIITLPSIHPDEPENVSQLEDIKTAGFKGIKMHPYYQDFFLDDTKLDRVYQKCSDLDLFVVMHTGFDIAFERIRRADPIRTIKVLEKFPNLKLITTHFGGWEDWDQVRQHLIGKPIYMELSFSLDYLSKETAKKMILAHPADYILFGTDSPWKSQQITLQLLKALNLPKSLENKILYENAKKLLTC